MAADSHTPSTHRVHHVDASEDIERARQYGRDLAEALKQAGRREERSDIAAKLRATIAQANADGDETGLFQDLLDDIERGK